MHHENSKGYFGSGNTTYDREMKKVLSANLTMDKETGLGNWTEEELIWPFVLAGSQTGQRSAAYDAGTCNHLRRGFGHPGLSANRACD